MQSLLASQLHAAPGRNSPTLSKAIQEPIKPRIAPPVNALESIEGRVPQMSSLGKTAQNGAKLHASNLFSLGKEDTSDSR
jgi:hypothetical protein